MADTDTATIRYHDDSWQIQSGISVRAAIEQVGLDPELVLAIIQKKLVTHQAIIQPQDDIRLVNIVTGG
ncbi:MAG: MoaD/ThiS family protein [Anaerolineae bacterium]|jgi:sulfur carrier protein ThiS|nr:hypothetical protein [Chloroflexota bacterium]